MSKVTGTLPFDEYSKHHFCSSLVELLHPKGGSLLEVAGGEGRRFAHFLRDWHLRVVEPTLGESVDVLQLGVKNDGRFDCVACLDSLSQLPPEHRETLFDQLMEAAGETLILAAPCADAGAAEEVDRWVAKFYQEAFGEPHLFLARHLAYGYPTLASLQTRLVDAGWKVHVWGQGNAEWLRALWPYAHCLKGDERTQRLAEKVNQHFNTHLAPFDHGPNSYRQVLVACRSLDPSAVRLPWPNATHPDAREEWVRLQELLCQWAPVEFRKSVEQLQGQLSRLHADLQGERKAREAAEMELRNVKNSRAWKMTAPLRRARSLAARCKRHLVRRVERIRESIEPLPEVAPRGSVNGRPLKDFVFFGVIPWQLRFQRPQHFCVELARRGHRVFHLSPDFVLNSKPGFRASRLDGDGRLFNLRAHFPREHSVYLDLPTEEQFDHLCESLKQMLEWAGISDCEAVVQTPFWLRLAQQIPGARITYDCMDHLAGFANIGKAVIEEEQALIREADLVMASARNLFEHCLANNPSTILVHNACEHSHFSKRPDEVYSDKRGRKVIGYYGAIAEWFDAEIVRDVATAYPDCQVLLVGADTAGVGEALSDLPNVEMTGEVPYQTLPKYLYGMDVCTIPFKINELTLATNPVKGYEYLCSGKPVVSTALPELRFFENTVHVAEDADEFVRLVGDALQEPLDSPERARRAVYAEGQTWSARVEALCDALEHLEEPVASIVIVTYNNLALTRKCVDSVLSAGGYVRIELVLVDNASTDQTPEYLRELEQTHPNVRVILNETNRGFSAANNQGLRAATGEYLVLLNNDTVVTDGWLRTMINHLRRDASIGILGPVTNNIGNEARIELDYGDLDQMRTAAARYTRRHAGETFDINVLAFFCVAFSRATFEQVGLLDEGFGLGFFEDDDYCQRIKQIGKRVVCAEDVFVHHELSASFNKLASQRKQELFEKNKAYYESKWGEWKPHVYRRRAA